MIGVGRSRGTGLVEKSERFTTNWDNAETFKTALGLNLIHAPEYQLLEDELLNLRFTGTRVDHGAGHTKDVADCVMQITRTLIGGHIDAFTTGKLGAQPLRATAQGGLPLPTSHDQEILNRLRTANRAGNRLRRRRPVSPPEWGFRDVERRLSR